MRCHPHPLATSDERFTTNATASSGRLAPTSAATVTRHGKPVRILSASTTPTSPASHNTPRYGVAHRRLARVLFALVECGDSPLAFRRGAAYPDTSYAQLWLEYQ